jgi:hypothetical protein
MTWCIVKKKQCLTVSFGQTFGNVDGGIDLREEFRRAEIPFPVLASFENDSSLPEEKSVKRKEWKKMARQTHHYLTSGPTQTLGSLRP